MIKKYRERYEKTRNIKNNDKYKKLYFKWRKKSKIL